MQNSLFPFIQDFVSIYSWQGGPQIHILLSFSLTDLNFDEHSVKQVHSELKPYSCVYA